MNDEGSGMERERNEKEWEALVRRGAWHESLVLDAAIKAGYIITYRWDFDHDERPVIKDFRIVRR